MFHDGSVVLMDYQVAFFGLKHSGDALGAESG